MKIFYLGMQRCGTKSFGEFFSKNGYRVWTHKDTQKAKLGKLVFERRYLEIINSGMFDDFDVFEDAPFYSPDFARFIANYVEGSSFVYFERPAAAWYDSMVKHSGGMTLGPVERHCYSYDRLDDLDYIRSNSDTKVHKLSLVGMRKHYINQYELHRDRIHALFRDMPSNRFYSDQLYNKDKLVKLNEAFQLKLKDLDEIHTHKSKLTVADILKNNNNAFS
jgi:hypothetical protein